MRMLTFKLPLHLYYYLQVLVFVFSCTDSETVKPAGLNKNDKDTAGVLLIVLGNLQDGGSPHAGCKKKCCRKLFDKPDPLRMVVSLGLIDVINKQTFMFEATPDISTQMKDLKNQSGFSENETPGGIFLTHAHIGHYAGLMYLGREAMNAKKVPVYAMPRMRKFIESNGPWSQLLKLENIGIKELEENIENVISPSFTLTAFGVPHRDEFSETVGYRIQGPNKSALFIPDIDKWEKWDRNIIEEIKKANYVFIDGTFYSGDEINNRNIKEIPHPFIIETMELLKSLKVQEKAKVYFIHFNHTNPILNQQSEEYQTLINNGFKVATKGLQLSL